MPNSIGENPPGDIIQSVPGAKKGARRAILNDLSPAACHIAYNYCTPVDVDALKAEFERIKAAVKGEFDSLYGAEHYEPALGLYEPTKPEVACHLKNPLPNTPQDSLISVVDREWELIDRSEVERRMGPEALAKQPLPEGVEQFICIPATIQYTVWSDVYKCEGMVAVQETTGRIYKKTGKPSMKSLTRPRGCGREFTLWEAAVDLSSGTIAGQFQCPHCDQSWQKRNLQKIADVPVLLTYETTALAMKRNGQVACKTIRLDRVPSSLDRQEIAKISSSRIPYWHPTHVVDMGREMMRHGMGKQGLERIGDFWTPRNRWAMGSLWKAINEATNLRVRNALRFAFTSIVFRVSRRRIVYCPPGGGWASTVISGTLYIPSLNAEANVWESFANKLGDGLQLAETRRSSDFVLVHLGDATTMVGVPSESIDYLFVDPPFGQNIYYADCSLLWEGWLDLFTDETREIVVNERRQNGPFKDLAEYGRLMGLSIKEMFRVLKPNRHATIEFNNSDGRVFEEVKRAVLGAGFEIANMLFLDKGGKTYKQMKGVINGEDVVDKDVLFNLHKPMPHRSRLSFGMHEDDMVPLVVEVVARHLRTLPERIQGDRATYTDEHRSTPFFNTMLMNSLIPRGLDVSRLNLPFIERVCARYFRKVDNRWYLRDEAVGDTVPKGNKSQLFQALEEDVAIQDQASAIAWLRQKLTTTPMRIGELRPHWMKATVKLTGDLSTQIEQLLRENFWLDRSNRRWRIPTADELGELNDHERQRACHDAERFLEGKLSPPPTDVEILGWIERLYSAAGRLEEEALGLVEPGEEPPLPAELVAYYRMMPRLLQSVLKENVDASAYTRASRQCRTATRKVEEEDARQKEAEGTDHSVSRQGKLFD